MPLVAVASDDEGVATVRIDNPPANALSTTLLWELAEVSHALTGDPPGAVVVTGGERIFAAGADITELGGPDEARRVGKAFHEALGAVAAIPRPVVAAISGYALGGGCELALACDLRVASDTAKLGQPEVTLGIIPGGGATQRLTRLVGAARAKDMIFTGRQVLADEALRIGLVDRVMPSTDVVDAAHALAASLAQGPAQALARAKRAIDEGLGRSLADGLALERELFVEVFATEDARAGVQSFRDHGPGKATFTGR